MIELKELEKINEKLNSFEIEIKSIKKDLDEIKKIILPLNSKSSVLLKFYLTFAIANVITFAGLIKIVEIILNFFKR